MGVGAAKPRVGRIGRNDWNVFSYDRRQAGSCTMANAAVIISDSKAISIIRYRFANVLAC